MRDKKDINEKLKQYQDRILKQQSSLKKTETISEIDINDANINVINKPKGIDETMHGIQSTSVLGSIEEMGQDNIDLESNFESRKVSSKSNNEEIFQKRRSKSGDNYKSQIIEKKKEELKLKIEANKKLMNATQRLNEFQK